LDCPFGRSGRSREVGGPDGGLRLPRQHGLDRPRHRPPGTRAEAPRRPRDKDLRGRGQGPLGDQREQHPLDPRIQSATGELAADDRVQAQPTPQPVQRIGAADRARGRQRELAPEIAASALAGSSGQDSAATKPRCRMLCERMPSSAQEAGSSRYGECLPPRRRRHPEEDIRTTSGCRGTPAQPQRARRAGIDGGYAMLFRLESSPKATRAETSETPSATYQPCWNT
jgi:hypothetical protein